MTLFEFIQSNVVDFSFNKVGEDFIPEMEKHLGMKVGAQLREYILKYGYLGYKFLQFNGVNNTQRLKSGMITSTEKLCANFPEASGYIILESKGDGVYALTDSEDNMYIFSLDDKKPVSTGKKLFDYILERFQEADKYDLGE